MDSMHIEHIADTFTVVPLTQTSKKGRAGKSNLIQSIRDALDDYAYVYLFELHNSRNNLIKAARARWPTSKFFFGKNKVMQVALGKTEQDEIKTNLHLLSNQIRGLCGLFMTNEPKEDVLQYFESYVVADYARSGFVATETIELEPGPLTQFTHSMEPHLRRLGMPTELKQGVVILRNKFTVCEKGKPLTPEQAKILKLLDIKMSNFRFFVIGYWHNDEYHQLVEDSERMAAQGDGDEIDAGSDVEDLDSNE